MPLDVGSVALGSGLFQQFSSSGPVSNLTGYTTNFVAPTNIIPYQQNALLLQLGFITPFQWNMISRMHGFTSDDLNTELTQLTQPLPNGMADLLVPRLNIPMQPHNRFHQVNKQWPSIAETLFLLNRQLISGQLAEFIIRMQTGGELALVNSWMNSRFEIPPPTDLIRFAVREAFTPELVSTFGYNRELPNAIIPWMEKLGFGGMTGLPMPQGSTTIDGPDPRQFASWFDLYWWSHWQLVSPTQGFEMLHRGYPTSPRGPSPDLFLENGLIDPNRVFTQQGLDNLLRASDYPQPWRPRLEMISYRPLTRVDTRRMRQMGIIDDDGVYHNYRAQGYNHQNAERLTQFTRQSVRAAGTKKWQFQTVKELDSLYIDGVLSLAEFANRLADIGFSLEELEAHISNVDLQIRHLEIKESIKTIKIAFLDGFFDIDLTRQSLTRLGIQNLTIQRYLRIWQLKKFGERKYVSANKQVEWYKKRLQSRDLTIGNIITLRFTFEQANKMLDEADFDLAVSRQKQLERIEKERIRSAKEIQKASERIAKERARESAKQIKEEISSREKAQRKALSAYTDKNIIAFYSNEDLDKNDIRIILAARGWDDEAIESWIEAYIEPLDQSEEENEEEEATP